MKVTADVEHAVDDHSLAFNWLCTDNKGGKLFDEEYDPEKNYTMMGVLFKAEKFGLECFNGSTFAFKYRISEDYKNMLMANSIFVAPVDENNAPIEDAKVTQLPVNTTDNNSVSAYVTGLVTVADLSEKNTVKAAGVMIMIPMHFKTDSIDILEIDNVTVTLKSGAQVGDLDGYNKNATPHEGEIEIQKKQKTNEVKLDGDDVPLKSKIKNIVGIVGLSILGIAVLVGIVFAIIKAKKRFY